MVGASGFEPTPVKKTRQLRAFVYPVISAEPETVPGSLNRKLGEGGAV